MVQRIISLPIVSGFRKVKILSFASAKKKMQLAIQSELDQEE